MLNDGKIYLRAPEPDADVDAMYRWETDELSWADGRTRAPLSRHALWEYATNYDADPLRAGQARFIICSVQTDESLGCLDLYEIDIINRRAGLGIYIESHNRKKGYARAAIELMAAYSREHLGLHQLWSIVSSSNEASRKLFGSTEFTVAGHLRSWIRLGESYTDAYVFQRLLI